MYEVLTVMDLPLWPSSDLIIDWSLEGCGVCCSEGNCDSRIGRYVCEV